MRRRCVTLRRLRATHTAMSPPRSPIVPTIVRAAALAVALVACACNGAGRSERPPPETRGATSARPPRPADPAAASSGQMQPISSASTTPPAALTPPAPPAKATVERLPVPGDVPASMVRSADGKPPRIVFLPGICSNAGAYLWSFAETARARGGAVAIDGDAPCGGSKDFHSITSDPAHEGPRIDAALTAAGVASPATADVVLVGYSLGATLIENLVKASPERWRRVVLIGSPRDPRLDRLRGAGAVATLSCALDVPGRMKGAVRMLNAASIPAAYFEMPGCTHGNIADGDRVFGEVFGWLDGALPAPNPR